MLPVVEVAVEVRAGSVDARERSPCCLPVDLAADHVIRAPYERLSDVLSAATGVVFPHMDRGARWDCRRGTLRGVMLG
jgi:hypothetical protein